MDSMFFGIMFMKTTTEKRVYTRQKSVGKTTGFWRFCVVQVAWRLLDSTRYLISTKGCRQIGEKTANKIPLC